jgi:phytoene dehydrogenase-like protein
MRAGRLLDVPADVAFAGMAPPGCHAVTIYTIAPNRLRHGSWGERREELAEKLLGEAEKVIPGLRAGARRRRCRCRLSVVQSSW